MDPNREGVLRACHASVALGSHDNGASARATRTSALPTPSLLNVTIAALAGGTQTEYEPFRARGTSIVWGAPLSRPVFVPPAKL